MARTELGFRPQGLHLKAYVGLIFGAILFAFVVIASVFGEHGGFEVAGAIMAASIASYSSISGAYGIWGRLHILVDDDEWCLITWRLGRWSRTKRFPRADVRSVRIRIADAGDSAFGPTSDRVVEIDIQRERRPLRLGRGFYLDAESMAAIAAAFGCDLLPSSPD